LPPQLSGFSTHLGFKQQNIKAKAVTLNQLGLLLASLINYQHQLITCEKNSKRQPVKMMGIEKHCPYIKKISTDPDKVVTDRT
jgi:hypothetical protein